MKDKSVYRDIKISKNSEELRGFGAHTEDGSAALEQSRSPICSLKIVVSPSVDTVGMTY